MPDPPAGESLAARLARQIAASGPITVADYMARANAHYYAMRDPLGAAGDFITAPEISQMFGELVGAWLADLWQRSGAPGGCRYVELGPGRGTLAADALRAMRAAGLEPPVDLVETSRALRTLQAERLPQARWHDTVDSLPDTGPLLIVANEFFDALPIRQFVTTGSGWTERMVTHAEGGFLPLPGGRIDDSPIPEPFLLAPASTIFEASPAGAAVVAALSTRIAAQGGVLLIVDYGHANSATGDTLQAVRSHRYADPWTEPGEADLTAHVDFEALARASPLRRFGPVEQGAWLRAIGIDLRADALARAAPDRASDIAAARDRLVESDQMGLLFKVIALAASGWADPAGFA